MTRASFLVLALFLAVAPGCKTLSACMAADGSPKLAHTGDEVLHAIESAVATGVSPESPAWAAVVGDLLARFGACLAAAIVDAFRHLGEGTEHEAVREACARCVVQHHTHEPRPEHRAYLERALRLVR